MRIEFVRVVGVYDDNRRKPAISQHVEQVVGHTLRNDDRQASVHTEPLQVRDACQGFDEIRERGIDERQRIAAAKNDLVNCVVGGNFINRGLPIGERARRFIVGKGPAKAG